jgi:hypothetical protein
MLEHSRKVLEFLDTPVAPEAFDWLVFFGPQVLEQLSFTGELAITRLAGVVAFWRGAWARMSFEAFVCVEILLTVTAPKFRRPTRVMMGKPVPMEGCITAKRLLAGEAVEAF